jgi:Skp family chaperone for outer membrane proteins
MTMMGSAPVGGGGLSFEDVIGLLKNEPAYQTKLRELQKRTEEARANLEQAVEVSRKTEENKKLVQGMLDQTTQQVLEANKLKEAADKQAAATAAHEKDLAAEHEAFTKQAEAELEGHRQHLRDAFTTREKEVAAKEQELLAKIKAFEATQADHDAKMHEFDDLKRAKEAEFARVQGDLRERNKELAEATAEVAGMKRDITAKLDAIRAISAK